MLYIHQLPDWPNLHWQQETVANVLAATRYKQDQMLARISSVSPDLMREHLLTILTEDVVSTSQIEGEKLDVGQVRSSVARRMGMDTAGQVHSNRQVDGIVDLVLDATGNYSDPLTQDRLFGWHTALFSTGRSGLVRLTVGNWRDDSTGPMQIVSGPIGREQVHFEAPASDRVDDEMQAFLDWFNAPAEMDCVLKAAMAHFWFVTVHPFSDGNGRTARAIADMALARSEDSPKRFYSMSSQILRERNNYYLELETAEKGTLDITRWMVWFLECLGRAIDNADQVLTGVFARARFWDAIAGHSLNDRQRKVINLLLNEFKGKLTSTKWAKITKCSHDTAQRDITVLIDLGILARSDTGGRSTSYRLVLDGNARPGFMGHARESMERNRRLGELLAKS